MSKHIEDYNYITVDTAPEHCEFEYQKTNSGYKKFLKCKECGKRVTKLYLKDDELSCRECAGVRYYSQNRYITISDKILIEKAKILLKFNITDANMLTNIAGQCLEHKLLEWIIERPKRMRYETYFKYINRLKRLEEARVQYMSKQGDSIYKTYKAYVKDGIW